MAHADFTYPQLHHYCLFNRCVSCRSCGKHLVSGYTSTTAQNATMHFSVWHQL